MTDLPITIGQIDKNTSEQIRVNLQEFKGLPLVDIRVYGRFSAAKVHMPSSKGIAFNPALLPELIRLLHNAETEARKLGLILGKGV